ncbi:M48 family metallopeptidase [Natronorubrum tibetense]|uniref:Heat shock protein HtpX n=1 Tax=Natronorubrum tibetense GA33 TaxID=1114856 RepID=L9VRG2_9EURY|nr:M48 family metalloprotease [Natronorubrum tibetense]ELY39800.1 heat shock protein HtpX [Natronorubrum tibetense GA33]
MFATVRERIESVEHWELLTLMLLTCAAIVTLYTLGILIVRPFFFGMDFHVYLITAFLVAVGLAGYQYWRSYRIIKQDGVKLQEADHPQLHRSARRFARDFDIEKPELRLLDDPVPNAYAIGGPKNGVVFFNTGLLNTLDERETEAILVHELAHLKHRDSIVMMLAGAVRQLMRRGAFYIALSVVIAANMLFSEDEQKEESQLEYAIVAGTTAFVSGLVLFFSRALSRYREYVADLTAARAIDDPNSMISALRSLEVATAGGKDVENDQAASLYIMNRVEGRLAMLFQTHPSTEQRIDVLGSVEILQR